MARLTRVRRILRRAAHAVDGAALRSSLDALCIALGDGVPFEPADDAQAAARPERPAPVRLRRSVSPTIM